MNPQKVESSAAKKWSRGAMMAVFGGLAVPVVAAPTTVHVVMPNGISAVGTQVYVNGELRGQTAPSGNIVLNLNKGDEVVARKRIRESLHWKGTHSVNGSANWNYRVYITSVRVNNDGTTSKHVVNTPGTTQNVVISRANTLIGANWLVSAEWDTTFAERETLRERIRAASDYLYNATDGQFFIEQVRFTDQTVWWADSDMKVLTNNSHRAIVNTYLGGFLVQKKNAHSYMNLSRKNDHKVYIHEFGHYGFELFDEYEDDDDGILCTKKLLDTSSPYGTGKPQASCMMYHQWEGTKICSHLAANPHNKATGWEEESCWQHLTDLYQDPWLNDRYAFRTPTSRGVVPMKIALPVAAWSPQIVSHNWDQPNLVPPATLNSAGMSYEEPTKRMVYLHETYGGRILKQGNIWFNHEDPALNKLQLVGLHEGDWIKADEYFLSYVGKGGVIAGLQPRNYVASLGAGWLQAPSYSLRRDPNWLPLQVGVGLVDDRKVVEVVVKSPSPFAEKPTLAIQHNGDGRRRSRQTPVPMRRVDDSTFVGRINVASEDAMEGMIVVEATARDGRSAKTVREFATSDADPRGFTQFADPLGELIVRMKSPAVDRGELVAIGPSEAPAPKLPGWFTMIEPKKVTRENSTRFKRPVSLVFQVETPDEDPARNPNYEYQVVRWDEATGVWEPVNTVQHRTLQVATHSAATAGHYALLARSARTAPIPLLTVQDGHGH
ncbi:MAG: hypothetical protein ACO1SV_21250 [Fimbriimonas sp.]